VRGGHTGVVLVAGVGGFEVSDGDLLEAGDEFADAAVVFDPGAAALDLFGGEAAGDGLAGDFAGPLPVGAMGAGWVGLAGAAGFAAAGVALLD
jgi:hypothetical protein